jgi:hypothetical protein
MVAISTQIMCVSAMLAGRGLQVQRKVEGSSRRPAAKNTVCVRVDACIRRKRASPPTLAAKMGHPSFSTLTRRLTRSRGLQTPTDSHSTGKKKPALFSRRQTYRACSQTKLKPGSETSLPQHGITGEHAADWAPRSAGPITSSLLGVIAVRSKRMRSHIGGVESPSGENVGVV